MVTSGDVNYLKDGYHGCDAKHIGLNGIWISLLASSGRKLLDRNLICGIVDLSMGILLVRSRCFVVLEALEDLLAVEILPHFVEFVPLDALGVAVHFDFDGGTQGESVYSHDDCILVQVSEVSLNCFEQARAN